MLPSAVRRAVLGFVCSVAFAAFWPRGADAAFLRAEPDDYPAGTAIPDNIGAYLRNSDYPPGHAEFSRSWRRIYAIAPDAYVGCGPSTGNLVLANQNEPYFEGTDYGLRAFFNSPTPYLGFDICWSKRWDWSEGARVQIYGNDVNGAEIVLVNRVYRASGSFTSFSLFYPGMTRARITCWDDVTTAKQKAFSIDNFRFVDTSGTAFAIANGQTIEAPAGMEVRPADSLSDNGSVTGNVTNRGAVRPGSSPGRLKVVGDFTQTAEGNCFIELAGAAAGQFDVLEVSGTANLGGTLTVTLDGFFPNVGDQFTVLTYGTRTNSFDRIDLPDGLAFGVDYGTSGLNLTVLAVPEPGAALLLAIACCALARRRSR